MLIAKKLLDTHGPHISLPLDQTSISRAHRPEKGGHFFYAARRNEGPSCNGRNRQRSAARPDELRDSLQLDEGDGAGAKAR
jgi:hypothetical protein